MGLKETVAAAATAIFNGIGNIASTYTYLQDPTGSYDPATGAVTAGGTSYSISAVRYEYEAREVDGISVLATDARLLFLQSAAGFTPKIGDEVTVGSKQWKVINVIEDPANVTWDLQIRRP